MSSFLRLARVELSRLLHRRAVLVLIGVCLVMPVVIGVSVALDTRPPSAAQVAEAEQQLERDRNDPAYEEQIDYCIENPEEWGVSGTDEEIEERCRKQNEPQLDWYLYSSQLDLATESDAGSGIGLAVLLCLAMLLAGTTFTGADWGSGSVSNQLLFEPRRARVWFAKALAVSATAILLAVVVMSSYWLALNALAASRDLPSGGALLLDCLQMGWRVAAVAGLAALVGFALTTLFRSTVATVGILFGISLAGGIVLGLLGVSDRWNPAVNVAAVVADGAQYYAEVPCSPEQVEEMGGGSGEDFGSCAEERTLPFSQGAGFLGTTVAGACLLSLLVFRRRDVP